VAERVKQGAGDRGGGSSAASWRNQAVSLNGPARGQSISVAVARNFADLDAVKSIADSYRAELGGIGVGVGLSTNPVATAQQPGANPDDAKEQKAEAREIDWRIRALDDQIAKLRELQKQTEQKAAAIERTIGELRAQRDRFLKNPDGKILLPGEIKRDLNRGVVLREDTASRIPQRRYRSRLTIVSPTRISVAIRGRSRTRSRSRNTSLT
jgi:hypothetical protein